MPIDYSKYPPNWLSEIRPRILSRANYKCEFCGLEHKQVVWAVRYKTKTTWYNCFDEADKKPRSIETKRDGTPLKNPKPVKVVLTIAHLDHDETNHEVSDDRLKALCQLCHLRYDAKEKYRRKNNLIPSNSGE